MNYKRLSNKQHRAIIKEFNMDLFSYTGQVAWFMPGIFSFVLICLLIIPVGELSNKDNYIWFIEIMLSALISRLVLLPYINVTDSMSPQNTKSRTFDKLKYLPVSRKQYKRVLMQQLFSYMWKLTVIGLVVHCIFALLIAKRIEIFDVTYVVTILFILPMLTGALDADICMR